MEPLTLGRKSFLFLCFIFIFSGVISSQSKRFDSSGVMARFLRYAALESGILIATQASPYAVADISSTLQRLDNSLLSSQARKALAGIYFAGFHTETEQGTFLRNNFLLDIVPAFEVYPSKAYTFGTEESLGWNDRLPLLAVPFEFSLGSILYGKTRLEIREDHNVIDGSPELPKANVTNWIEDPSYIDWAFPFEAYIGAEYRQFSFSLGRDSLNWGPGKSGTLFISDAPDFYDFLQASFIATNLSYRFLWITLDPTVLPGELPNRADVVAWSKNLFVHRGEALFFNRLAFSVTEALVLGGKAADISYMNPFLIFHNRWAWDALYLPYKAAASLLSFELRLNPWRFIEAYGSFAMNQFQTPFEKDRYDSAASVIPDAFAWLAGIEAIYPLFGGWFHIGYEAVYTNPWMYIRENMLNSFVWRRRLPTNVPNYHFAYKDAPIGYEYGPDVMVNYVSVGFDAPGLVSINANFKRTAKGEQTLYILYEESAEAVAKKTPSGIPEITNEIFLNAEFFPLDDLMLTGTGRVGSIQNAAHIPGEKASLLDFSIGVEYTIHLDSSIKKR